jgi:hypothetical protein
MFFFMELTPGWMKLQQRSPSHMKPACFLNFSAMQSFVAATPGSGGNMLLRHWHEPVETLAAWAARRPDIRCGRAA